MATDGVVNYIPNRPALSPFFFLAPKRNHDFFNKGVYYFTYGRHALLSAFEIINLRPEENIIYPASICKTATDPALEYTKDLRFYELNDNIKETPDKIETLIDKKTRIVVVVHYAGFPARIEVVRSLCKKHNVLLIEDCSMALFSRHKDQLLGSFGDIAIFSFKKSLPIFEGAALVINNEHLPEPTNFGIDNKKIDSQRRKWLQISKEAGAKFRKNQKPDRKFLLRELDKQRDILGVYKNFPKYNPVSKEILKRTNSKKVIELRRRNYKYVLQNIDKTRFIPIYDPLPEGVCPMTFPVFTDDKKGIINQSFPKGIVLTEHWGKKIPGEVIDNNRYPIANKISRKGLSLPIHQSLKRKHLDFLTQTLNDTT
ncbi:DegT/DnrJ/EryC1/StrS family aminotransferase [Patescibacteria group bacterium]